MTDKTARGGKAGKVILAMVIGAFCALLMAGAIEGVSYLYLKMKLGPNISRFKHNFIAPESNPGDGPILTAKRYFSFTRILAYMPNDNVAGLRTNKYGFISNRNDANDEYKDPKPADTIRIIFIGASAASGQGASSNEATIAAVLEKDLAKKIGGERKVEVINAAMGAYTMPMVAMALMNELIPAFWPDMIIILDGGTDALNYDTRAEDYYRQQIDRVSGINNFGKYIQKVQQGDFSLAQLLTMKYKVTPGKIDGYYLTEAIKVFKGKSELTLKPPAPQHELLDIVRGDIKFSIGAFLYYEAAARGVARENGIPLLHVLQPAIVFKKTLSARERDSLSLKEYETREVNSFISVFKTFFHKAGDAFRKIQEKEDPSAVRMADLSSLFENDQDEMFIDDVHYNDPANRRIGEALAPIALEMINKKKAAR
ncbi:MAG: SGNH/GDSL hydrolase family protein [Nitrospinae bacterium]|nr:SGNH/GDSL hydrolase family protein [Nitrospinota bacterium]